LSAWSLLFGFIVLADNSPPSDEPQDESISSVKKAVASGPSVVIQNTFAHRKNSGVIGEVVFVIKGDDGVVEFTDQKPVDSGREFTKKLLNQNIQNVIPEFKAPLVKSRSISVIQNNVVLNNHVNSPNIANDNKESTCRYDQGRLEWLRSKMRAVYHHTQSNRLHEQERIFKKKIEEYCR